MTVLELFLQLLELELTSRDHAPVRRNDETAYSSPEVRRPLEVAHGRDGLARWYGLKISRPALALTPTNVSCARGVSTTHCSQISHVERPHAPRDVPSQNITSRQARVAQIKTHPMHTRAPASFA